MNPVQLKIALAQQGARVDDGIRGAIASVPDFTPDTLDLTLPDGVRVRVPVGAIRPHVPPQPQMGPEDPGPFAFADLVRVRRILSSAGFDRITAHPFDMQLPLGETFNDAVAHLQDFGPVARMLAEASEAQRATAAAATGHSRSLRLMG